MPKHHRRRRPYGRALMTAALAAAATSTAGAATLPAGSLIANPSFEAGTAGWSGYNAAIAAAPAADAPAGASVARVTRSTGTYFTIDDLPDTVRSTVAGTPFHAEAWVRSAAASSNGKPIYLRLRERTPAGAVVREWSSPAAVLGTTFARLAVDATATATGNSLDARVSQTSAGTGNAFLVDAVTLVPAGGAPPPPPSVVDVVPPAVALTSPTAGAVVSGSVPVLATAIDDVAVDRVEFRVNGVLRWTERYTPYRMGATGLWDTTAEPNGTYAIEARAVDTAGNAAVSTVTVTVANVAAPPPPPPPPPSEGLDPGAYPFDPVAAVNQPVPAGTASDARSAGIVRQLAENAAAAKVVLSNRSDVPTVYTVAATDPWFTASVGGRTVRFRVPATAVPGEGADQPMVLQDPAHPDYGAYTELRLWQAAIDRANGRLTASGAGLFHYNNDGALFGGVRSLGQPFLGSGTGWGLAATTGLVRPEEVAAGEIRHAIRFAYSSPDFITGYRAPALKSDQPRNTATRNPDTAMVMGMRLQLDPAVDCSARTVPGLPSTSKETRALRIICRALQRYGMIVGDGTSDRGVMLLMEHSTTAGWDAVMGPERYGSYSHLIRDVTSPSDGLVRDATSGIPWNRMRVLAVSQFPAG